MSMKKGGRQGTNGEIGRNGNSLQEYFHHGTAIALDVLCILSDLIFTTTLRKLTNENSGFRKILLVAQVTQ